MLGMNRQSGTSLAGIEHLKQSVVDILTTPIGTRIMRLDYGSDLPRLVDRPTGPELLIDLYIAVAVLSPGALDRWEPRLASERVRAVQVGPGQIELALSGLLRPEGTPVTLDGIVI